MKRMLSAILIGVVTLAALAVMQGCGVLGGPPTGVAVSADPDESDEVVVSWTVPAEGGPDKYIVYFRAVNDSGYVVIGETTATSYTHDPHGATGQYKVVAAFGADTYEAAEKPTTIPVFSDGEVLFEINSDSSMCAYGWSRDSGVGEVFGMIHAADSAHVDFYVSDRAAGSGDSLHIVSPNKADSTDPGAFGLVPEAGWRMNGFSNPLLDAQSPLPAYDTAPYTYFIFTRLTTLPCYVACYTAGEVEKHYALIQVDSMDAPTGRVWLKSWYQLVPGLRLIRH